MHCNARRHENPNIIWSLRPTCKVSCITALCMILCHGVMHCHAVHDVMHVFHDSCIGHVHDGGSLPLPSLSTVDENDEVSGEVPTPSPVNARGGKLPPGMKPHPLGGDVPCQQKPHSLPGTTSTQGVITPLASTILTLSHSHHWEGRRTNVNPFSHMWVMHG